MTKELSRYPRALSENVNSELINRLYESGGSLSIDLIVYLANYQMKNLFGENWFSIADFCEKMGYERTKLQRKLSEDQLRFIFGGRSPHYITTDTEGNEIKHPIQTVFEAALYRLGIENLGFPTQKDGKTSYHFVQILTRFDIQTDFTTKKGTKRLYSATLNDLIKDSLFTRYNLTDLHDYRKLPDRKGYRYFYLNLSRMVYLIRYKIIQGQAPFYTTTVDQLAKIFKVNVADNNNRKMNVASILDNINRYLDVTKFQYEFVKGENERWAYTVQFHFPNETLEYIDQKFTAVFTDKFYSELQQVYVKTYYPHLDSRSVDLKVAEIRNDLDQYQDFIRWAHSDQSEELVELKGTIYRSTFISVFKQAPEALGLELFNLDLKI